VVFTYSHCAVLMARVGPFPPPTGGELSVQNWWLWSTMYNSKDACIHLELSGLIAGNFHGKTEGGNGKARFFAPRLLPYFMHRRDHGQSRRIQSRRNGKHATFLLSTLKQWRFTITIPSCFSTLRLTDNYRNQELLSYAVVLDPKTRCWFKRTDPDRS
jgi:hypothetical protein